MKKTANSNMYEVSLIQTWDRFDAHLEGSFQAIACVISERSLSEVAKAACVSSVAALGYGSDACAFVTLEGARAGAGAGAGLGAGEGAGAGAGEGSGVGGASCATIPNVIGSEQLGGNHLFSAVEGLDPLFLIIADDKAREACSQAYRQPIDVSDKGRLLGRDVVAFRDFEALLQNNADKQKAWGLLKRLPRLDS